MNLTLSRVKAMTRKALEDHNLDRNTEVASAEWLGERCRERHGSAHFRSARVRLVTTLTDGRQATTWKSATVDTTGYFRIS